MMAVHCSSGTVINYFNAGQLRSAIEIASLDWFLHSNKACFMFDYSNEIDSGSKAWLHENELGRISRGIFARNALVKSWVCHTGESMSKKWKRATGVVPRWDCGFVRIQVARKRRPYCPDILILMKPLLPGIGIEFVIGEP